MASKSERHVGKLFRIDLGALEVLALCLWRDERYGYLLKWFPKNSDENTLDPVETPEFLYSFIQLDRAIRRGEATFIRSVEGFIKFRPPLRKGGGINPKGGQMPWVISSLTSEEWVEPDDPRLRGLSDFGLATLPFMETMYLENVTPEEMYRRKQGNP